jgi:hypothetical protein
MVAWPANEWLTSGLQTVLDDLFAVPGFLGMRVLKEWP